MNNTHHQKSKELNRFYNDSREKKELPNGKIVSVVAQTGWKLLKIEAPRNNTFHNSEQFSK